MQATTDGMWAKVRAEMPAMVGESMRESNDPLVAVIDHTMLRVGILGAVGMILAFVLGLLFVRLTRRPAA